MGPIPIDYRVNMCKKSGSMDLDMKYGGTGRSLPHSICHSLLPVISAVCTLSLTVEIYSLQSWGK